MPTSTLGNDCLMVWVGVGIDPFGFYEGFLNWEVLPGILTFPSNIR